MFFRDERTENTIKELRNKIGDEEFKKLKDTVELKAEEIVQGILTQGFEI